MKKLKLLPLVKRKRLYAIMKPWRRNHGCRENILAVNIRQSAKHRQQARRGGVARLRREKLAARRRSAII